MKLLIQEIFLALLVIPIISGLNPTRIRNKNLRSQDHKINSEIEGNIALGKPVIVVTNGKNENRENPGLYPSDIVDGSLDYLPSSLAQEDGSVGYVNDDYNELMEISVTIDLKGTYDISKIRYNMGNVQLGQTWNADLMISPLGTSDTNTGGDYVGAWTEHYGSETLSSVTIIFQKTRTTPYTDWLFIGEIEIFGTPSGSYFPSFDLPIEYPNRGNATEQQFIQAWKNCTTSFFDHKFPTEPGDNKILLWTGGDPISAAAVNECILFDNCYDGHEGNDFDDYLYGDAVYPVASGQIIEEKTGWIKNDGYGYRIVIQHGTSGFETMYGHLSEILVNSGEVDKNTQIGKIGSSGCDGCGSHLHLNVYYNGQLVDPNGWLGDYPDPYVVERGGPESLRLWLFPVQRRADVNHTSGFDLVAPSGDTVLFIPENSYSEDFEISITEVPPFNIPEYLLSTGHGGLLSARKILGGQIYGFEKDYTLEVRFNEDDVSNLNIKSLSVYFWDLDLDKWIKLPTEIDVSYQSNTRNELHIEGSASVSTDRFGYFSLFGEPIEKLFLPLIIK